MTNDDEGIRGDTESTMPSQRSLTKSLALVCTVEKSWGVAMLESFVRDLINVSESDGTFHGIK